MVATLIPEPFRSQLVEAGKMAGAESRSQNWLALIASSIDTIRVNCAQAHPHLFRQEVDHD